MTYEEYMIGHREFIPRADFDYPWPQRFMPDHYDDTILQSGNEYDRQQHNWLYAPHDVLNQDDTISMQDLEEAAEALDFQSAGFAEETAVDTFINMNGDTRYVTTI